ncbi:MAG: hypothetical protein SFW07_05190 [Gammaproteobacteria bacterium]|nr:hypothetical protein [Gammaproteobacteria bacterium]
MYNPDKHGEDYENYILSVVKPVIDRQHKRAEMFRKIRSSIGSAAKNIAIGFGVAAIALASVHVVGVHVLGFHVVRAAHVLCEAAFAFGAIGLTKWVHDKVVANEKLSSKVVEAKSKSAPTLMQSHKVESEGGSGAGLRFKSFFLGIKARFSALSLKMDVLASETFKDEGGARPTGLTKTSG